MSDEIEAEQRKQNEYAKSLVGKVIADVRIPVGYPCQTESIEITFTDGETLCVYSGGGGCSECDPDGIGWGININ